MFWRWATVLTFTYGSLPPHLRSGGLSSCVEGYWHRTEGITCLMSAGPSKFQCPPSGSQQSPPPPRASPDLPDGVMAAYPGRDPTVLCQTSLPLSVKAETRFFCSTLRRRREGVKLLFFVFTMQNLSTWCS